MTGSLKFDGAQTDRANPRTQELRRLAGIADDDVILLAGSTQAPEEEYALRILQSLAGEHPKLRLIVVPRHKEHFDEVAEVIKRSAVAWRRRSEMDVAKPQATCDAPFEEGIGAAATSRDVTHRRWSCLLVDAIGELGAWWGAAHVGFVGGSFGGRGGQNMLEPAAYGVAVSFGPNTWNFRDIVRRLLDADGAQVVASEEELGAFVRRTLNDPAWAAALGERARALVLSQQGATRRTVNLLAALIEQSPADGAQSRAA